MVPDVSNERIFILRSKGPLQLVKLDATRSFVMSGIHQRRSDTCWSYWAQICVVWCRWACLCTDCLLVRPLQNTSSPFYRTRPHRHLPQLCNTPLPLTLPLLPQLYNTPLPLTLPLPFRVRILM